jgi:Xaa-Pro aminopeptidase
MFAAKTYCERRNRLKKQIESGLIVLFGNDESPMNYPDNAYHFRQDSTFLYFFGLDSPGLVAVIDIDENREIILGNELTIDDIVWMGAQPSLAEKSHLVGVNNTAPAIRLAEIVTVAQAKKRPIHFLPPYRSENKIKLFELLGIVPARLKESVSLELIKAVVAQRIYKSKEEIEEIDKAANISVDMHLAAMKMAKPGMIEREIAAEVQRIAQAAGGQIAFPIILTINGQTLHNHFHGNTLKSGDMVLCDFGAETELHYCADLSSTFPVDLKFTARQREIYAISLSVHDAAIANLRPGVKFKEVHLAACKKIVEGMKSLGLMKGNVDDAVAAGAHAMFFPCGTGHMMGLDVHDMEDIGETYVGYDGEPKSTQFGLKSLRLARELQPGFVLTIEPGIYFIPELIDKWRAEKRFGDFLDYSKMELYKTFCGIRNEENFLITQDGYRLLGKKKPKSIEEVEALRGQAKQF